VLDDDVLPVAIITGASSGIGEALTRHLLAKQWRVVMADINATKGQSLAAELGSNVAFFETDVSSWTSQVKLFEQAYERSGNRFDFLASMPELLMRETSRKVFLKKAMRSEDPIISLLRQLDRHNICCSIICTLSG
jgi:NAD(P)-dependent dehydrogenase (short-subunit alcohol dehydrogenase family)